MSPAWQTLHVVSMPVGVQMVGWSKVRFLGRTMRCRFLLGRRFGVSPQRLSDVFKQSQDVQFSADGIRESVFLYSWKKDEFVRCGASGM